MYPDPQLTIKFGTCDFLDLNGTIDGICSRIELCQSAISHFLQPFAMMFFHKGFLDIPAFMYQCQRPGIILTHESSVTHYVSKHYCSKLAHRYGYGLRKYLKLNLKRNITCMNLILQYDIENIFSPEYKASLFSKK